MYTYIDMHMYTYLFCRVYYDLHAISFVMCVKFIPKMSHITKLIP